MRQQTIKQEDLIAEQRVIITRATLCRLAYVVVVDALTNYPKLPQGSVFHSRYSFRKKSFIVWKKCM